MAGSQLYWDSDFLCVGAIGFMPTCPKCGKMISAQRYSRHLQRCGSTHKNKSKVLDHPDNFFMKI